VQALLAQLKPTPPHLVVVESTGGLEQTLVAGLQRAAMPVAIVAIAAHVDHGIDRTGTTHNLSSGTQDFSPIETRFWFSLLSLINIRSQQAYLG
jgi:hypothetical protein